MSSYRDFTIYFELKRYCEEKDYKTAFELFQKLLKEELKKNYFNNTSFIIAYFPLIKYLDFEHKITFSNIFLDTLYQYKPEEINEALFHFLYDYVKVDNYDLEYSKYNGQCKEREDIFYSELLPSEIIKNCTNYSIIPCKIINRNKNVLFLFEANSCKASICPFISIEKLLRDNFPEVERLSKDEFTDLIRIMDKKVLNSNAYLNNEFNRVFCFYKELEFINENSFINQLHHYKIPWRTGYLIGDEFAWYFISSKESSISYVIINNREYNGYSDVVEFENNLSNEMKELMANDLAKIKANLLIEELKGE